MIGRWTAISAAHCFWDRFANVPVVSAAAAVGVASSGSRYPNGPWTITSQTRFKPTQLWGCYDVYFPALWQSTANRDYDMGVIEFGCGLPGANGNWLPVGWPNDNSVYANIEVNLEAYDSLKHEADVMGRFEMNGTGFADPTLRVRRYTAPNSVQIDNNPLKLVTASLDFTLGSSGGCARQKIDGPWGYWWCVGVVSYGTNDSNGFGGTGYLRRFEPDFWAFVQTFSEY